MFDILVPTLKEVIEFLRKQSLSHSLFNSVPIGTAALVCLECTKVGYTLHASSDEDDIICDPLSYEGWGTLYLADSDAELRETAHRIISTVAEQIFA